MKNSNSSWRKTFPLIVYIKWISWSIRDAIIEFSTNGIVIQTENECRMNVYLSMWDKEDGWSSLGKQTRAPRASRQNWPASTGSTLSAIHSWPFSSTSTIGLAPWFGIKMGLKPFWQKGRVLEWIRQTIPGELSVTSLKNK